MALSQFHVATQRELRLANASLQLMIDESMKLPFGLQPQLFKLAHVGLLYLTLEPFKS